MTREVILQFKEKMKPTIRIFSDKMKIIDPQKFEKNIFSIFAQKSLVIETADTGKNRYRIIGRIARELFSILNSKIRKPKH